MDVSIILAELSFISRARKSKHSIDQFGHTDSISNKKCFSNFWPHQFRNLNKELIYTLHINLWNPKSGVIVTDYDVQANRTSQKPVLALTSSSSSNYRSIFHSSPDKLISFIAIVTYSLHFLVSHNNYKYQNFNSSQKLNTYTPCS